MSAFVQPGPASVGVHRETGAWGVDDGSAAWEPAPRVQGRLVLDSAQLAAAAHDQGNIVQVQPGAILEPATAADIAAMVQFCRRWRIPVAARGSSHTSFGQSLAPGLSIAMRSLDTVRDVSPTVVDASGGALWCDVVAQGAGRDMRVATGVPSILRLTVGGVLSVGGISTSRTAGGVVDAVIELDVVTGTGELVTCSPERHRDLFEAVLAGLGQFGIITRARLRMVPVPPRVRAFTFRYPHRDIRQALADQRLLSDRAGIDELLIRWVQQPSGPPVAELGAAIYYAPDDPPAADQVLHGLSQTSPARTSDMDFMERAESVDRRYLGYEADGWSDTVKVWSDNFLPDVDTAQAAASSHPSPADNFIVAVLEELTERDWSPTSPVLLFRKHRNAFTRPSLRLPDPHRGRHVCLFDVSSDSFAKEPDEAYIPDLMARNRRWYEAARDLGGTMYPLGAVSMTQPDWVQHYGAEYYALLAERKKTYDPAGILTPGVPIFPSVSDDFGLRQ